MLGALRFDGLSSGIDYQSIIDALVESKQAQIDKYKTKIDSVTEKKNAFLDVNATLLAFKGTVAALARPSFWSTTKIDSSNESVLAASGSYVGMTGSLMFSARRLAQSHQMISSGFADKNLTSVTSTDGTLSIELGGGHLERRTQTAFLNAQAGFDRGSIRVTDSAGRVGTINLEGVVTMQDVLDEINNTTSVAVRATVEADRLVIQDRAGGVGSLVIEDYGADETASALGIAGTSVVVGGGKYVFGGDINTVSASTMLTRLNDGLGVRRNSDGAVDFTITDTDGIAFGVDISSTDTTLGDVIDKINTSAGVAGSSLTASLASGGNALVLTDAAGASAVSVALDPLSMAAVDLGLGVVVGAAFVQNAAETAATGLENAATGNRLVGSPLTPSLNSTMRMLLNGGQTNLDAGDVKGVRNGSITLQDRLGNSTSVNVSARVATTAAAGAAVGATSLDLAGADGFAVGNRFRVQTSAGIEYRTVTSISGATITFDKALVGATTGGDGVFALNGSVEDIVRTLNDRAAAAGVGIRVGINAQGDGLKVTDTTGGSAANLDVSGLAANDLGISGSVATTYINGTDLDPQYLGETTLLADMNAGQGVPAGKFRIIDTDGNRFDIDLTQAGDTTLGRVITEINGAAAGAGSGVTARINDTGDGLIIEDGTPGSGILQIQELNGGSTAKYLNILGTASPGTPAVIDGSFEYEIAIAANSKLQDVATAINSRAIGVLASVVNDGMPINPYKLTLASRYSGEDGRMTVRSSMPSLSFTTTAAAQDAVLLYGSNGGTMDPAVLTSSENMFTDVVPGLTLQLKGISASPVTVTISRDTEAITEQVGQFVESYNDVIAKIREYTSFNADSYTTGLLFGESSIRRIRRELEDGVVQPVTGISTSDLNALSGVGIRLTDMGAMTFDESKFTEQVQQDLNKVIQLFTKQRQLTVGTLAKDLNSGRGISNVAGDDFVVRSRNATTSFNVDISGVRTVGDILQRINAASGNGGTIEARVSSDGFTIELVDLSTPATRGIDAVVDATTFVENDADIDALADDALVGATVTFLTGSNAGEVRTITDFDTATNEITLDSGMLFAMAPGDTYRIEREMEVEDLGVSTAAAELKIAKRATLGQNTLTGGILGLENDPGVASRMSEQLDVITRSGDGMISTRTDSLDDKIDGYNESIEKIEEKVSRMTERLVLQFTRLEQVIQESQATQQRLQSLISSLGSMSRSSA